MITLSPTNNRLYFLKAIFPYKKCILIKLYMLPSDGIFSIKTAFIFGNTFFRFFPWGKNKTKKIKRKEKIGWNQKSYCFRTGKFISDLKLFIMIEHFCPKKKAYKITITFSNAVVQFAFSPLAHWLAWLFRMFFRHFLAFILSMPSKMIITVIKSMFLDINMFCALLRVIF